MKTLRITKNRYAALEAMSRFYFLTPSQLVRLGVTTDRSNLSSRVLNPLLNSPQPLIQYNQVGPSKVYALTKQGSAWMSEQLVVQRVPYPQKIRYERDFEHRTACIDFLIDLWEWCSNTGTTIEFVRPYYRFVPVKGPRDTFRALTRHELSSGFLVSDLEFRLQTSNGKNRLFAFELHRTERAVGEVYDELSRHISALKHGIIARDYRQPELNDVLSVYTHPSVMKSTMSRLSSNPDFHQFKHLFHFAASADLRTNFGNGWTSISADLSNFFAQTESELK